MPEFNGGYDIISDYLNSLKYSKYKEVFTKYNFDYAIVYYNSNLYSYLKEDKDYKQIYNENNNYILFQKIVSN